MSWTERFNSAGLEWKASGTGETLENNPNRSKPVMGGNTFVYVETDGNDLGHADGKTAVKAQELIRKHKDEPFWLGVGFVRPHVPFVAPAKYYSNYKPYNQLELPEKINGDWEDIPLAGINYKTSENMKMDTIQQQKAIGSYYASVAYMDAQVGKVLNTLEESGLRDKTIVVFTSDHGFHLGEHYFWAKVCLLDESSRVPLIISVPGKASGVCHSFIELLDLYRTISKLAGLELPKHIQGMDISQMLDEPQYKLRDAAFAVAPIREGFLLRKDKYSFIQYGENAENGVDLYDTYRDPNQYTNLAILSENQNLVNDFKNKITIKIKEVRDNDLEIDYN